MHFSLFQPLDNVLVSLDSLLVFFDNLLASFDNISVYVRLNIASFSCMNIRECAFSGFCNTLHAKRDIYVVKRDIYVVKKKTYKLSKETKNISLCALAVVSVSWQCPGLFGQFVCLFLIT